MFFDLVWEGLFNDKGLMVLVLLSRYRAYVELPWGFQILFLSPLLRHVFGQKGLAAVLHLAQFGQRVPLDAEEVCFWMKP